MITYDGRHYQPLFYENEGFKTNSQVTILIQSLIKRLRDDGGCAPNNMEKYFSS